MVIGRWDSRNALIDSHKKVRCHADSHHDYEPPHPELRKTQRIMCSEVAPQSRPTNHDQRLRPIDCMLRDKDDYGQAIGGAAEDSLQGIHFVNVGHPECRQHCEENESHASAEVASVDSDYKLERGRRDDCSCARVMTNPGSTAGSRQFATEDEEQSRYNH